MLVPVFANVQKGAEVGVLTFPGGSAVCKIASGTRERPEELQSQLRELWSHLSDVFSRRRGLSSRLRKCDTASVNCSFTSASCPVATVTPSARHERFQKVQFESMNHSVV